MEHLLGALHFFLVSNRDSVQMKRERENPNMLLGYNMAR